MKTMSFDLQPVLNGERLLLRPLSPDDVDGLYAAAADPLIWAQHPASNRHELPVFRQFFDAAMASRGALAVIDKASGAIIGSSRFHGYDPERREVEIGWTFLARRYWGGDFNREMKALMLAHAFQHVRRVVFLIGPDNIRSQRAVQKIGGVKIGERMNGDGLKSDVYAVSA
ncbi:GNAT family N-acetyltransferase [Marinicaulis aureus]|uniref:GNAT family N-acetyltransferase n=1 Tax=Hyphococcus aureus TaxID=2666033 RepID=A0ABW1L2B6_9PROT